MLRKKIINELKNLLLQRGQITRQQREYAMVEEQVIIKLHPITKPSQEVKFSKSRTLESYIGTHDARVLARVRVNI